MRKGFALPGAMKDFLAKSSVFELEIDKIVINPQVRVEFTDLELLADSIKDDGLTSPIAVNKIDDTYYLVAGERRVRAAKMAGASKIAVRVFENLTELQVRTKQVQENINRVDISLFEEISGVSADIQRFGFPMAIQIWRKPKTWVSKRNATSDGFPDVLLELVKSRKITDIEIFAGLKALAIEDRAEFDKKIKKLTESEGAISRDEARGISKEQRMTKAGLSNAKLFDDFDPQDDPKEIEASYGAVFLPSLSKIPKNLAIEVLEGLLKAVKEKGAQEAWLALHECPEKIDRKAKPENVYQLKRGKK